MTRSSAFLTGIGRQAVTCHPTGNPLQLSGERMESGARSTGHHRSIRLQPRSSGEQLSRVLLRESEYWAAHLYRAGSWTCATARRRRDRPSEDIIGQRHAHPHYLKGTVWCNRCKRRFVVQRAKGRQASCHHEDAEWSRVHSALLAALALGLDPVLASTLDVCYVSPAFR
jgi:hypothetical protein